MLRENQLELAVVPQACETLEFKAFNDDAWYSVAVSLEGQNLRIKYLNFSDEYDNVFEATDFKSLKELEDFKERFRPLSKQLQDYECRQLVKGVEVCACHTFGPDDVRFYDALVDDVLEQEHSEELCSCRFILLWLHGPNYGNLTDTTIETICAVQPVLELDTLLASFLKVARERLEFISPRPITMSKGVSPLEVVPYRNKSLNTPRRLSFFDRLQQDKRRARRSVVKLGSSQDRMASQSQLNELRHRLLKKQGGDGPCSNSPSSTSSLGPAFGNSSLTIAGPDVQPSKKQRVAEKALKNALEGKRLARHSVVKLGSSQVSRHHRRMEESDLEGMKNQCVILIGNLDKQLCPSTIAEFLGGHTSVSPQVFIFPSLSSEIYNRGAIVLNSEEDFQVLCRFLNDPNLIITSSTGRPWVIMEKLVGLKRIRASIGTLVPLSEITLQNGNCGTSNNLKVVRSGTREFKIASDLRDLFLEFYNHQAQLYKKLALEERKMFAV